MSKRRKLIILFAGIILAVGLVLVLTRKREPEYKGRPLSYYVRQIDSTSGGRTFEQAVVANAIRQIGTNAIPFFLEWIQYDEPDWLLNLRATADYRLGRNIFSSGNYQRANLTVHAFRALGPAADEAIEPLVRMATDPIPGKSQGRAIYSLARSQRPKALPPLINILTNGATTSRMTVAGALQFMGATARPAVPILITCLKDRDEMVARYSAITLGQLQLDPEMVVPALTQALTDNRPFVRANAASALMRYGEAARPAIPKLVLALQDSDRWIRHVATKAILEIQPEALTNAPAK